MNHNNTGYWVLLALLATLVLLGVYIYYQSVAMPVPVAPLPDATSTLEVLETPYNPATDKLKG